MLRNEKDAHLHEVFGKTFSTVYAAMRPIVFQDLGNFSTAVGVRASCNPPRAARRRGAAVPVLVGKIAATELHLQLNRA